MPSDHRPVDPARAAVATVFGLVLVLLGGLMIWRKLWEARARLPAAPLPPIHRRTRPPARQEHQYPMTRILVLAFSTLVLLSGFSTTQTSATVRALRALDLRGGEDGAQKPMFAVVVPNALTKTLRVLIDEIDGDHRANSEAAPTSQGDATGAE